MTKINIDEKVVNKSQAEVFAFLADFNNYSALMPSSISGWSATEDTCKFKFSMAPEISMTIVERNSPNNIKIIGSGPMDFTLNVNTKEISAGSTGVSMVFEAELNMFMKMMIEKPMKEFFEYLAKKVENHFNA